MNDLERIENCYRQMYRGMVEKDRDMLLELLDDTFVLVHMTGMRQSKASFIQAVEDGTLNYYSVNHQRIDTNPQGQSAELTGQSVVSAEVFGGGRRTWRLQLKLRLIQKSGNWKIAEARASVY